TGFCACFYKFSISKAYQYLFEDLFDTVEKNTQKPFEFQHVHSCGLGCIIADEHQGQALAISNETKELIYSITKLNTHEEILNVLEKIKKSNEPGTA
ncbi:42503_t:CDS:2, partial [Gigaspora margarita]